jgi:hypothetical protein
LVLKSRGNSVLFTDEEDHLSRISWKHPRMHFRKEPGDETRMPKPATPRKK